MGALATQNQASVFAKQAGSVRFAPTDAPLVFGERIAPNRVVATMGLPVIM